MILFHIYNTDFKLSNRRAIKSWIRTVLDSYGKKTGDINIIFCDSEYLLEINKKYLKHDYYTDVITFPYTEAKSTKIDGDIFIDVETVRLNAKKYVQTFKNEILRVIIHGILHLTGKDDSTKEQQTEMRNAEDTALRLFTERRENEI
ncbi:MAG TPA: rRNA maturation RNase YbeY [Bacteroidales bacterium]|jgi:rRNA maturation RNase YbeY|nr:rRNA maturation RNase YbeY [Bacteroidales bacterium]